MDLPRLLHEIFLKSPTNRFDTFIEECKRWYSKPAHSLTELRSRDNKKIRGDIFEEFCVLFLKMKGYKQVWRLQDVPEEILTKLSLKRRDMGIDIICEKDGGYSAVQCKYKSPSGKRMGITWKTLSTFYAYAMRSGPWDKYIVMTNCHYTSRVGKSEKDLSICLNSFQAINTEEWFSMCSPPSTIEVRTIEEVREARLKFFAPQ